MKEYGLTDEELRALLDRTKEGEIKIDEQS